MITRFILTLITVFILAGTLQAQAQEDWVLDKFPFDILRTGLSNPSYLIATAIDSTQIDISWTDNSDDETYFLIERSTGGAFSQIDSVEADDTAYSNTGLTKDITYYYRVRAKDTVSYSGYTNTASANTYVLPLQPTVLIATALGTTSIGLEWTDNSDNESYFVIERAYPGQGFIIIDSVVADEVTYTHTGLDHDQKYIYRIKASNIIGYSAYSNIDTATTDNEIPLAPEQLIVTAQDSSVIYGTFQDYSDNEDYYLIYRSLDNDSYAQVDSFVLAGQSVIPDQTGLESNTKYYYKMRGGNEIGYSDYSNVDSATTDDVVPLQPTVLSATTVDTSSIDLAWTDNSDNEDYFVIERGVNGVDFVAVDSVVADEVTFSDTGLTPETEYFYRVRASNLIGYSENYTNIDSATTNSAGIEHNEDNIIEVLAVKYGTGSTLAEVVADCFPVLVHTDTLWSGYAKTDSALIVRRTFDEDEGLYDYNYTGIDTYVRQELYIADYGTYEVYGTEYWNAYSTNTIQTTPDSYAGDSAFMLVADGSHANGSVLQMSDSKGLVTNLELSHFYNFQFAGKCGDGRVDLQIGYQTGYAFNQELPKTYTAYDIVIGAVVDVNGYSRFNGAGAGDTAYVDDITVQERWGAGIWLADQSGNYNHLFNNTALEQGLWVTDSTAMLQDGVDDIIEVGSTIGNIQSVVIRLNIDDAESISLQDASTHSIESSSNTVTATGWSSPTFYVDGVATATYTSNVWTTIGVTTATPFEATAFQTDTGAMWYTSIIAIKYEITEAEMLLLHQKLNE